jgi:hypothetical protein
MSCNKCGSTNKCGCDIGLTFQVDGSFLAPYVNGVPLEPVDLSGVTSGAGNETSLVLDPIGVALVYTSEAALSGDTIPDTIPIQSIAGMIKLAQLSDVDNGVPTNGDFLVYDGGAHQWNGESPTPATLITALGYDSDGNLRLQDVTALTRPPVDNDPRINNQTSVATLTFDTSSYDQWNLTAQAVGLTLASPGAAADSVSIRIKIKDNGTAQGISWNAIFRAVGVTLPTATVANRVLWIGARYNAQDSKWDVLAIGRE